MKRKIKKRKLRIRFSQRLQNKYEIPLKKKKIKVKRDNSRSNNFRNCLPQCCLAMRVAYHRLAQEGQMSTVNESVKIRRFYKNSTFPKTEMVNY